MLITSKCIHVGVKIIMSKTLTGALLNILNYETSLKKMVNELEDTVKWTIEDNEGLISWITEPYGKSIVFWFDEDNYLTNPLIEVLCRSACLASSTINMHRVSGLGCLGVEINPIHIEDNDEHLFKWYKALIELQYEYSKELAWCEHQAVCVYLSLQMKPMGKDMVKMGLLTPRGKFSNLLLYTQDASRCI